MAASTYAPNDMIALQHLTFSGNICVDDLRGNRAQRIFFSFYGSVDSWISHQFKRNPNWFFERGIQKLL